MDVTFRESIPFYGEKTDLSGLFLDLDSSDTCEVGDEENGPLVTVDAEESRRNKVITGLIPYPVVVSEPTNVERERTSHTERNLQVYTRRRRNPSVQPSPVSDEDGTQVEQPQLVQQEQLPIDDNEVDNPSAPSGEDINSSIDLPIATRKGMRSTVGKPPERYGFEGGNEDKNDIANYVSYESLSSTCKAFVASLQLVAIPRAWKEAK